MYRHTDELGIASEEMAKNIIGEIVLSERPEEAIKKWRSIFKLSQKQLASELGITSSVISDYESGRRRSPGIKMIRKYVDALIRLDLENGGSIVRGFVRNLGEQPLSSAVLDIKEFSMGYGTVEFAKALDGDMVVKGTRDSKVYGYTIIDSLKAITDLSYQELVKLYGITTQRCLIFTKVRTGRTPMVAIKLTNLKPAMVVLHGLSVVDEIGKRIAEAENIPLAISRIRDEGEIPKKLEGFK